MFIFVVHLQVIRNWNVDFYMLLAAKGLVVTKEHNCCLFTAGKTNSCDVTISLSVTITLSTGEMHASPSKSCERCLKTLQDVKTSQSSPWSTLKSYMHDLSAPYLFLYNRFNLSWQKNVQGEVLQAWQATLICGLDLSYEIPFHVCVGTETVVGVVESR